MPTLKLASSKTSIITSGITSSNVSSSLSGNMSLIKSQIKQKTNDYINVKNATKILEKYSNHNGYIKLYTEVQSNIDESDIVYITYLDSNIDSETVKIENPTTPDEGGNRFYLGYKVLYVNPYKNEIVINKYYNDIEPGKKLKHQYISKISCKNSDFFDNTSDGVVLYSCNVLNSNFGTLTGVVSGSTISGATILCMGIKRTSDSEGKYSIAAPVGHSIVKCSADGYITKTFSVTMNKNAKINYDILMTSGQNSITISGRTTKCEYETSILTATTIGYDEPVKYQWKLNRYGSILNIGTDNYQIAYVPFENNDIVYCEVTDDITTSTSNELVINVVPKNITITSTTTTIYIGQNVTFNVNTICYLNPTFQWKINDSHQGTSNTFSTTALKNNDVVTCVVNGDISNSITMRVLYYPIALGYSSSIYSNACVATKNTYYINSTSFLTSSRLYTSQTGNTYANTGWYSDSIYSRYWNKTLLKFTMNELCSSYTTIIPTTISSLTTTTTTTTV